MNITSSRFPNDKWKRIINLIITILTAIASTFAVQSCIEINEETKFGESQLGIRNEGFYAKVSSLLTPNWIKIPNP